jgi:hypothetical protein
VRPAVVDVERELAGALVGAIDRETAEQVTARGRGVLLPDLHFDLVVDAEGQAQVQQHAATVQHAARVGSHVGAAAGPQHQVGLVNALLRADAGQADNMQEGHRPSPSDGCLQARPG